MPLLRDLPLSYRLEIPSGRDPAETMPLVICLHGRGSDADDLAELAPLLDSAPGYRFLFPQAPKPFAPGPGMSFGFSWFDGWPPARAAVVESRGRILDFLGEITERYPVDGDRIVLAGFSQGAMMAMDAGFRAARQPRGIVMMSGVLFEDDAPQFEARRDQKVLIVHGTNDDVIPIRAAWRARAVLEEHGLEPEYHEFAMGHNVTPESMAVVGDFLRRCLA
jgi:phospholipase/carboxylesterase